MLDYRVFVIDATELQSGRQAPTGSPDHAGSRSCKLRLTVNWRNQLATVEPFDEGPVQNIPHSDA